NGVGGALRLRAPGSRVEGNVISSADTGLLAFGDASDLEIVDNFFGTDQLETADLGMDTAIRILLGSQDNLISGNVITNNNSGVTIVSGNGNRITANSIHNNTVIGIDLGEDGATANDVADNDTGANNLQNAPDISQADLSGGNLTITYRVDTVGVAAQYPLEIEFFISDGNGQGQTLIGTNTYLAVERRTEKTIVLAVVGVSGGEQLVATATDLFGNTSEFGLEFNVDGGA
ncbi:MAG: DUF1565 domain-containing protein, partial [Pirellulaceae bacterium]|nr:DUF1565 domain-containing protein [Pirellulaceae bacterium]